MESKRTAKGQKQQLNHKWSRPPAEILKINADAAFHRGSNSGGWGLIIRDDQCKAMAASAGNGSLGIVVCY